MPSLKASKGGSPSPRQRVAVTGANGFIGAHCVASLLKAGFDVVAVVRDPSNDDKVGFLRQISEEPSSEGSLTIASGDLSRTGSYDDAFKGCHGVVHTAAVVEIGRVQDPESKIVRPSVEGTKNVLDSIVKNSATVERYVHISSVAAVQSLDKDLDEHVFVDSDWNTWSTVETDAYGYAKTAAERLVWETLTADVGVELVVINPSVVLGPCYCKSHTKSSTYFMRQMLYGNPTATFNASFVDVRDVAEGVSLAFTRPSEHVASKRFILSCAGPMSTIDLNAIAKKSRPWVKGMSAKPSPTALRLISAVGDLSGWLSFMPNEYQLTNMTKKIRFDSSRSKEALGVTYTPIEDTCRDSIDSMEPFVKIPDWGGSKS